MKNLNLCINQLNTALNIDYGTLSLKTKKPPFGGSLMFYCVLVWFFVDLERLVFSGRLVGFSGRLDFVTL